MSASCDDLEPYLDQSLEGARRERFEEHLLGCAKCQAALDDAMQLMAAGAELARSPDRPRAALIEGRKPARRRFWWALGGAIAAAAAAAIALLIVRPRPDGPTVEDRIVAVLAPSQSSAVRLPYAPLDRHRRYDVERGTAAPENVPPELMAEVAKTRSTAAYVAVLLARQDFAQAEAVLARAGRDGDDDLETERAALAIARGQVQKALAHLDRVLDHAPEHPVALWNRGLVLDALGLPLAAAEAFDAATRRREPGWSTEAAERAARLREPTKARAAHWKAAKDACGKMPEGLPPDPAVVREYANTCRTDFYAAVRVAPSRDILRALAPIAEALDASANNTAASELLRRVTSMDPTRREHGVALYRRAIKLSDPAAGERRQLLDQVRAADDQGDLVLGALTRPQLLPEHREEYVKRARATGDPYYAEVAEVQHAEDLRARGDLLGAEVVLKKAVSACSAREVELYCANLRFALVDLYEVMHRPLEARAAAQAGLERSRRLALYWDERLFFDYIAKAMRLGREHALMRAYAREATLRADECVQRRYNQEQLAMASIDDLRSPQARRDIAAAPVCDYPPTAARARVLAELARFDGTAEEARALQSELARMRQQPDLTAGQRANLDAIEGRLLAARDPAAARPLLRRAIEAADRAGRADADAAIARRDAYGALLVLGAAGGGDAAASLALLAEAAGTAPRDGACAVGVMVDAERMLVVVRDARGGLAQDFAPKRRDKPELDAAALIPPEMIRSLTGCERVDVLALPPVFGLSRLLPPELAWSYRGRPGGGAAGTPMASPVVVTVAGTTPPPELALAPLPLRQLAPIPNATHVDVIGVEATPARVVRELARADAIEIHAHGYVDQGISDASVIALSPQPDGRFALDAREIAGLQLARSPLVILAACHAAYTAPYRHEPWGLPRAFLVAGARAVLASPDPISDAEAGEAFRAIEARILAGTDPAIALRDERRQRLAADPKNWIRNVLLFD